jgi:hypothetical protein
MRVTTPVGIAIDLRPDWCDITDDLDDENVPFTLAREEGYGALQFSIATYKAGPLPDASTDTLLKFLQEFEQSRELGPAADVCTETHPLRLAAGSFHTQSFIRVWYLSDGRNFAFVTFTCNPAHAAEELRDCEQMVRTISFL